MTQDSATTPSPVSPFLRGKLYRNAQGEVVEPDNVILSLSGAYTQYSILRQDNIARVDLFAALEGCAAGNPPFDQEELEANGLGHKGNFNDFKFRSYIERASQAYWNLLNSTQSFIKIFLKGNFPQLARWETIMSRNLSDILKEWEDFYTVMNQVGRQLALFGLCPIFWPHEKSFMWQVVDVGRFFIPTQTETLASKLTNCCIESTYTIQDLYQIYKKIGDEPTSDWNKDALAGFLIWKANTLLKNNGPMYTNFQEIQRMIDNHDLVATQYFNDSVRLVNLYQQEFDGKVSHYIFDRDRLATAKFDVGVAIGYGLNDFLYFANRQYDCIQDAIQVMTASPGEWTVHGSIGVGQKTFAGTQATNMLTCSVLDMCIMAATPLIRTLATGGKTTDQIKFIPGAATDIGAAEFIQNQMGANINQLVVGSQFLTATLDTNAVNAGDDPGVPDRSQGSISPSEARSRDFKEFGILKNNVAHFYNQFDNVIHRMFLRLISASSTDPGYDFKKEWIERCVAEGVPQQLFDFQKKGFKGLPIQFKSIKASRIAGDGSNLARIMGLEALDKIAPAFNQKEMAAYKQEWVEATFGPDYVSTFASSDDQADENQGGASLAAAENFMMQQGANPVFSPDNDQEAHVGTHLALLIDTVKKLQGQEISPIDADKIFSPAVPHTLQHIQFMEGIPLLYGQALQKIVPTFKQVEKIAQLNRKNAESMVEAAQRKQQEDAAATQEVMDKNKREDFLAQEENRRANEKQAAQIERNKETAQTRGEIQKMAVEKKAENDRLKTVLTTQAKTATAKGQSQEDLLNSTPEDLQDLHDSMIGQTPSAVDFEVPNIPKPFNEKLPL